MPANTVSIRDSLTPPTRFDGSMRRALRDEYLEPAARVSLRAQLGRHAVYDSVVVLVHGVNESAEIGYGNLEANLRARWPRELARTLFVRLFWGAEPVYGWTTQVGWRTNLVYGLSALAWTGTAKLADAIGRVQAELGRGCPICVVAYSLGCAVTLAAAQEGLHLDNVILMGSPLDQTIVDRELENTRFSELLAIVRGEVINCSSTEDGWTLVGGTLSELGNALPPGVDARPIGRYGLPARWIAHPRVTNLYVDGVDHREADGWLPSNWMAPTVIWRGETPEHFVEVLTCRSLPRAPFPIVPRRARALAQHQSHVVGDTRHGWGGSDDVNTFDEVIYIPGQAVVSWHFANKDVAEYTVEVSHGHLRAQLFEAVGVDFARQSSPNQASAGAGPVSDRLATAGAADAVYRLTITNPGVEAAIARIRFWAEDI